MLWSERLAPSNDTIDYRHQTVGHKEVRRWTLRELIQRGGGASSMAYYYVMGSKGSRSCLLTCFTKQLGFLVLLKSGLEDLFFDVRLPRENKKF